MIGKSKVGRMNLVWIFVLGLAVSHVYAGGFYLAVEKPELSKDPKAKGAVVLVRPYGCHEAEKAVVSGTAQGVVNGTRQTVVLQLTPLMQPGIYAIHRNWPTEGKWVLSFTAKHEARTTNASVEVGP